MIRDGNTDALRVEHPSLGALKAELSVPVPLGTADVGGLPFGSELTSTVVEVVSLVAAGA